MTEDQLIKVMVAEIKDLLPELEDTDISGTDSLVELGLNSMDRIDVIMAAQNEVSANIPMTSFAPAKCIADIARIIQDANA
ncbi:phosphopantetheine-binding protein [Kordiimonas gwangyangensis]|uniref:phosphopantetheine-binding protein n=1 Tax=Kordiimonas gwangyangensis TaxID=288022 RepID=UPI00036945C2|nr:phosphopantetheine-binding protein [Kordiimonas gwangyangensis]